ncbi:hypothetical protein RJ639_043896 [Escallonia herrerae]|uniref:FRIGIDA-like protein n=1 Tax=Escallonia herrerae TaxID=1293975 RepID=A0AA88WBP1_9ASTE|nr:hypothetical protein RJ639_043896 [Escallonia herrerae]
MGSLENLSASVRLAESKKSSLRKAILLLLLEWKGLDQQLDSTEHAFEGCARELESREERLNSIRESLDTRAKQLEERESEFHAFQEEKISDLNAKAEQLDSIWESVDNSLEEAQYREEKLEEQQKLVEGVFERLELEESKLEVLRDSVREMLEEIRSKEKLVVNRSKEMDCIQDWMERRRKKLYGKEERLQEWEKVLDARAKELDSKELKVKERERDLDARAKLNEEGKKEIELKEKEIESRSKQLDSVKKFSSQRFKEFWVMKKKLISDEKLLEERVKELEIKEKDLEMRVLNAPVKIEPLEEMPLHDYADIIFCITMGAKDLQIFLNERARDHDTMSDEVFRALRFSLDPAKLILDAMQGFYPPHLKKGDVEFEGSVVRRSCILLLEQLMRMSPEIQPRVKEEALKLAEEWKAKMRVRAENSLEVLGFLHLLAAYGLTSAFDSDELSSLFETVAEHSQSLELCRLLLSTDRVPDLVHYLINKNHHLVAIKFVCSFGVHDKFPPVLLLKDCLKRINITKGLLMPNKGNEPREARNRAIDKRVAALRDVIKCIADNKLDSVYSAKVVEGHIEWLIRQKEDSNCTASAPSNISQEQQIGEKKHMPSTTAALSTKALPAAPVPSKAASSVLGPATAFSLILAKMDGKRLLSFLNEHVEDHEMMRDEVFTALQLSFDPATLVLNAIQGFHPPHTKTGDEEFESAVIRSSCMLLLEQLIRLSPHIKARVREAAAELAIEWKYEMRVETANPLDSLAFLLLLGAYNLGAYFDINEFPSLFENLAQHSHASELCQLLGFSEKIQASGIINRQANIEQSTSENLQLNDAVTSSSKDPRHDISSLDANTNGKRKMHTSVDSEAPTCFKNSSDPAKLVLDAVQGSYHSITEGNKSFKLDVTTSFSSLLEQLMRFSPEIKPCVIQEAVVFAVEWRTRLLESTPKPSEVKRSTFKESDSTGLGKPVSGPHNKLFSAHSRASSGLWRSMTKTEVVSSCLADIIQHLSQKGEQLLAIRYIYAFGLADEFPSVPLLEKHLHTSKELAEKLREEGQNSPEAQNKAIITEILALRRAIKCIAAHSLEYSSENLRIRIVQLQKQKVKPKDCITFAAQKAQSQQQETKKRPVLASILPLKAERQRQQAIKRPRVTVPGEAAPSAATSYSTYSTHQSPTLHQGAEAVPRGGTAHLVHWAHESPYQHQGGPFVQQGGSYCFHSIEAPSEDQGGLFTEQSGPSRGASSVNYGLLGSRPVMPHMSHLAWQR